MPDKKILILGASGIVGRALLRRWGPQRAVATYFRRPFPGGTRFDAATMSAADLVQDPGAFSHALLLLGETNLDACKRDGERSYFLNVTRIRRLIDELLALGIVPVFGSTESVFDGKKGMYTEEDPASPIVEYGRQKAAVENHLAGCGADFLILRFSKIFGSDPADGSLFTSSAAAFLEGKTVRGAYDQIHTMIHVDDLARLTDTLLASGARGIFHLASRTPYSRYELLRLFLERLKAVRPVPGALERHSIDDLKLLEKRPVDVSLNPAKVMAQTGDAARPVTELLAEIADLYAKSVY